MEEKIIENNTTEENNSVEEIKTEEKVEKTKSQETKPDDKASETKSSERETNSPEKSKAPERRERPATGNYSNRPRNFRPNKFRRRVCRFCYQEDLKVDYKDKELLEKFITERGKIFPRRVTGTCAKHQRLIAQAIKRARILALLPFIEK